MDDDALAGAFEDLSLPFDEWKHLTHLRIAWIYVDRYTFEDAVERLRRGIQAYNAANSVPEGPNMGYHETVTVAWLRIIDTLRRVSGPESDSEAFVNRHTQLHSKVALRFFYSPAQIMNDRAKREFVEPDLAALPSVPRSPSPDAGERLH